MVRFGCMRFVSRLTYAVLSLFLLAGAAQAQVAATADPRQLALDVYTGVSRSMPPASVALKLEQVIEVFRYRCNRVTDYQVYTIRPNLIDIKAKCSGDPLYGVTVASNGYVAVYGGNGILSGLDRRDAVIYSFEADGDLAFDSTLTAEDAVDEARSRIVLGGEYNYIYVMGMFTLIAAILAVGVVIWLRLWRRKSGRKPRQRMKPMQKHTVKVGSSLKDKLLDESREVAKFVRKHPGGIYIAIGKRGKRRFFKSYFWARAYAKVGIKMFEVPVSQKLYEELTAKAAEQEA